MILLVDTHVWLWMLSEPARLPERVQETVAAPATTVLVSAATAWEIAIKYAVGKLELPDEPQVYVPTRLLALGCSELPIDHLDAVAAGALPRHHADPFDRMLVAQALRRGIPLCSADRALEPYDVELLWG